MSVYEDDYTRKHYRETFAYLVSEVRKTLPPETEIFKRQELGLIGWKLGRDRRAYLAVNRVTKTEDGQTHEETTFVDVTLWGRTAEVAQQYLHKASPAFIEGRLQTDSWQDKQTGEKRSRLKIVGENMQLLGDRSRESAPPPPRPPQRTREPQPRPVGVREPDLDIETPF
jgi:single-strand DNA-binding protein